MEKADERAIMLNRKNYENTDKFTYSLETVLGDKGFKKENLDVNIIGQNFMQQKIYSSEGAGSICYRIHADATSYKEIGGTHQKTTEFGFIKGIGMDLKKVSEIVNETHEMYNTI